MLCSLGIKSFHVTRSVGNKYTHGDMDIIYLLPENVKDLFINLSHLYPSSSNGMVFSFLYKNFQIDLIQVRPEYYTYACNYFDWNDAGNIIGRMLNQLGFKHGFQGLSYVQKSKSCSTQVLKEHKLSYFYGDALKILKLPLYQFKKGFDTYTDLFDYCKSSPLFNAAIFQFENLNNKNRVRDRKRKTYNIFLEYIASSDCKKDIPLLSEKEKLEFVLNHFPSLKKELEIEDEKDRLNNLLKLKFNGNLVSDLTGLKGKGLGIFIASYKKIYTSSWILEASEKELKESILNTQEKFNANHTL